MYCEITGIDGPFKDAIALYVEYKRGLGYDYGQASLYGLREIDRFFALHGVLSPVVSEEMFELWTILKEGESANHRKDRVNVLIAFSKFLSARGFPNVFIGEPVSSPARRSFIPYIYSHEELGRIFNVFKTHTELSPGDMDLCSSAVLAAIYYGCGLRLMEALFLRMRDVDFDSGRLRIVDAKNHASRTVMASGSLRNQLMKYRDRFCAGRTQDALLFQNSTGMRFGEQKFRRVFHGVLGEAGIPLRESGHWPRIHDLRHTFCVHALESMAEDGRGLHASLPLLVAHLGHKSIAETEYYLRLVKENFSSVTDKCGAYAPSLFPKVGDGIEE